MKTMVVDWSVMMYISWHRMHSPNFETRTGLEIAEFARNIATHMTYLIERVAPDNIIIAMDSTPNWRKKVYADYYEHHMFFSQSMAEPKTWVIQYDKKTFLVKYREDMDHWICQKLSKVKIKELFLDNLKIWKLWSPCKMSAGSEVPWVQDSDDWENLAPYIPGYKSQRATSSWDYETSKHDFHVLGANLGYNLAGAFGAHVVRVPEAEGDDICATCVLAAPKDEELVLVTVDSDMHQLLVDRPDLKIFDPRKSQWVDKSSEGALYELTHKILTGDTADNIAGVSLIGSAVTLGDKGAEKYISEHGGPEKVWGFLLGETTDEGEVVRAPEADLDPLRRNLKLIAFSEIPEELTSQILSTVQEEMSKPIAVKSTLKDAGMTAADIISTKAMGRSDRDFDLGLRGGSCTEVDDLGRSAE